MDVPDRWIVVTTPEVDKVLMGWSGGYLDSDYWRINSGITRVDDEGDAYVFHGLSGSAYRCYKTRYGCTGLSGQILHRLLTESNAKIHPDYKTP